MRKMLDKFPFDKEIVSDLQVLNLSKKVELPYTHIMNLATKFAPAIDQDLKDEWKDFQLMNHQEVVSVDQERQSKKLDTAWKGILCKETPFGGPIEVPFDGQNVACPSLSPSQQH